MKEPTKLDRRLIREWRDTGLTADTLEAELDTGNMDIGDAYRDYQRLAARMCESDERFDAWCATWFTRAVAEVKAELRGERR